MRSTSKVDSYIELLWEQSFVRNISWTTQFEIWCKSVRGFNFIYFLLTESALIRELSKMIKVHIFFCAKSFNSLSGVMWVSKSRILWDKVTNNVKNIINVHDFFFMEMHVNLLFCLNRDFLPMYLSRWMG